MNPQAIRAITEMSDRGYALALFHGQMWEADFYPNTPDGRPFARGIAYKSLDPESAVLGAAAAFGVSG